MKRQGAWLRVELFEMNPENSLNVVNPMIACHLLALVSQVGTMILLLGLDLQLQIVLNH